jgi:hypothetical protein
MLPYLRNADDQSEPPTGRFFWEALAVVDTADAVARVRRQARVTGEFIVRMADNTERICKFATHRCGDDA